MPSTIGLKLLVTTIKLPVRWCKSESLSWRRTRTIWLKKWTSWNMRYKISKELISCKWTTFSTDFEKISKFSSTRNLWLLNRWLTQFTLFKILSKVPIYRSLKITKISIPITSTRKSIYKLKKYKNQKSISTNSCWMSICPCRL